MNSMYPVQMIFGLWHSSGTNTAELCFYSGLFPTLDHTLTVHPYWHSRCHRQLSHLLHCIPFTKMVWISPVTKVYTWGWWGDSKLQQARGPSQVASWPAPSSAAITCLTQWFGVCWKTVLEAQHWQRFTASSSGINFTIWTGIKFNYIVYL